MYRRDKEEGRWADAWIYQKVERALWGVAPIILLLTIYGLLSLEIVRRHAEADFAQAAAASNIRYCVKWGMPVGTERHAACLRDLDDIRAETERQVRLEIADAF